MTKHASTFASSADSSAHRAPIHDRLARWIVVLGLAVALGACSHEAKCNLFGGSQCAGGGGGGGPPPAAIGQSCKDVVCDGEGYCDTKTETCFAHRPKGSSCKGTVELVCDGTCVNDVCQ
jgi:hypothetical protein